jgi:hypothetical protein
VRYLTVSWLETEVRRRMAGQRQVLQAQPTRTQG